ncbi:DUF6986 family protein [Galactobacter caseinivorans]|uniref:DUF6986 family protein n=1 Tax=Galactobacter caseinivorans TaxID=2676123 RepID=UPI001F17AF42|nr:aldolase [Galactobacter caseinivorans]
MSTFPPQAHHGILNDADFDRADAALAGTDAILANDYPGDRDVRQPVHTVYVGMDRYTPELPEQWGQQALAAAGQHGGVAGVAELVGLGGDGALVAAVQAKLETEPIEDLRLDAEDGYGHHPEREDRDAVITATRLAEAMQRGLDPAFVGTRFKCLEAPTRRRGLRTLDLFVTTLMDRAGRLPDGLVITLPKVSTLDQVRVMVEVCRRLEQALGLPERRLGFEVQAETPQIILGQDGTVTAARLLGVGDHRITSLHYGTYDYSASLGIDAAYQSMEHPVADAAKDLLQLAVAGTGVHLSDGSTNILPVGEQAPAAWQLHARLVRRHLERGIKQGWDLHPAQLITRYLATYAYFRDGYVAAAGRLANYINGVEGAIMDEPATARALAGFLHRGLVCGAISAQELWAAAGMGPELVAAHARPPRRDA